MQSTLLSSLWLALVSFAVLPAARADVKLADGTMLPEKPYFIVSYLEVAPGATTSASTPPTPRSSAKSRPPRCSS